jgi:hypothetical protein
MPYEPHRNIETPPDDAVLWRFLDFARFLALIEGSSLWFARADLLGDPREGEFTDDELSHLRELEPSSPAGAGAGRVIASFKKTRRQCFVNCWYKNQRESTAMWKLYAPGAGGIAVKSSVGAIKHSLKSDRKILIGDVRYLDWTTESDWSLNVYPMVLRKHISYKSESEVRLCTWDAHVGAFTRSVNVSCVAAQMADELGRRAFDCSSTELREICEQAVIDSEERQALNKTRVGMPIDVSLGDLIDKLVVGPDQPDWVICLVIGLLKRYGISKEVTRSKG